MPFMTLLLIAINFFVFYHQAAAGPRGMEDIFSRFALIPSHFDLSRPFSQPFTHFTPFITSIFLHGNLMHIISNLWALWLFGDNVEDRMGPINFLLFYLACGIAAGAAHVYVNPASPVPTVGASGAIAGVMGAYFILYPRSQVLTLIPIFIIPWLVDIPAFVYLGFWLILQVAGGTAALVGGAAQIAFWAHVGGFAAGVILHRFFMIRQQTA